MRTTMFRRPTRTQAGQAGFTLIEFLLVLALAAVVAGVAFLAFNNANSGAQVYGAVRDVGIIQANLKNAFPNQQYAGLSTSTANEAHVFPADMNANNFAAGALITERWPGSTVSLLGGTTGTYTLTINGVPPQACAQFVSQAGQNMSNASVGTTAPGTSVFASGTLSPPAVASACAGTSPLTVVFTGS